MLLSNSDDDGAADSDVASMPDLTESSDEYPESPTSRFFKPVGQDKNGFEFSSGEGHLSNALRQSGMQDMSKDSVRQNLENCIAHIGPPCSSYSAACYPKVRSKRHPDY